MSLSSPMNKDPEPNPSGRDRPSTIYAYDSLDCLTSITDPFGEQSIPDGNVASSAAAAGGGGSMSVRRLLIERRQRLFRAVVDA